jgi:hypothetical protein
MRRLGIIHPSRQKKRDYVRNRAKMTSDKRRKTDKPKDKTRLETGQTTRKEGARWVQDKAIYSDHLLD